MTWSKTDTRLQCSPRFAAIARQNGLARAQRACLAWLAVLAVNAEHDCDGVLKPIYAHQDYLRQFAALLDEEQLLQGLADLEVAEMIDVDDGKLTITGWDQSWRTVMPSTARVRLHRDRKRAEREAKRKLTGPRANQPNLGFGAG